MRFKGRAVAGMLFFGLVVAACAATRSGGFEAPQLGEADAGNEASGGVGGGGAGAAGDATGGAGTSGGVGGSGGNVTVPCTAVPAVCDQVGTTQADQAYGCCAGDTVYYCKDVDGSWTLVAVDCTARAGVCGYDADYDAMYCVSSGEPDGGTGGTGGSATAVQCTGTPQACEDIGASKAAQDYGCCQGSTVYYCVDVKGVWKLQGEDCAATGEVCGFDDGLQVMGCISGGQGGAGGDAGTDGSADGSDASGAPVPSCGAIPQNCDDIAGDQAAQAYGCCMGNVVYYCADKHGTWSLLSADCEATQQRCGYDPNYEALYCVD